MSIRHLLVATATTALVLPLAASPASAHPPTSDANAAAATAVAWQRIAVRTIYTEGLQAPPVGTLYLAFTSLAVHDAARAATRSGGQSAQAAVAQAAHDVLVEYFPTSGTALADDLKRSLAAVPDGPAETAGIRTGARAAAKMIDRREDDGRGDPRFVYSKPMRPGFWQPAPGGVMAAAWLGFVDPLVRIENVRVNGPDPLRSAAYAGDYDEVRDLGSLEDSDRSDHQTRVARFFSFNPVAMYRTGLCELLIEEPLGLRATTRLFAKIDASVATTMIRTWRLKYRVGFWRPFEAVAGAGDDRNPATEPEEDWVSLIPTPAYSDYTSGHAAATSPFAAVMRATLGNDVALHLENPDLGMEEDYTNLTDLEHDALRARIWGGLHFRDAMEDGYFLGHRTARRVMRAMR